MNLFNGTNDYLATLASRNSTGAVNDGAEGPLGFWPVCSCLFEELNAEF